MKSTPPSAGGTSPADGAIYIPQADQHGVDERHWLLGTMCFPNDERLCRALAVTQAASDLVNDANAENIAERRGDERIPITRALLQNLIDTPDYTSLQQSMVEGIKQGTVAGDCLATVYIVSMFPNDLGEPSLRKAFHVARWFAGRSTYGDGLSMSARDATIRRYWDKCKPAVHLWAGFRLLQAFPRTFAREKLNRGLTTDEGVNELYGVAKTLANFGCNFIPPRTNPRVPLLDAAHIYKIPDEVTAIDLKLTSVPESLVEALRSYKAPLARY